LLPPIFRHHFRRYFAIFVAICFAALAADSADS